MPTRSTTSEYLPSPPISRIGRGGRVSGRLSVKTAGNSPGVKNNMCVAPATNGERAMGTLAPSQPASTKKGMGVSPTIAG